MSESGSGRMTGGWWSDIWTVALLALILLWATSTLAASEAGAAAAATTLLIPGILLLLGVYAGRLAVRLHLPRLTGYIICGCLIGPYALELLSQEQVALLKPVKDLAIGLIALMAGCEIRTAWLRSRLRSILIIVAAQATVIPLALVFGSFLPWLVLPYLTTATGDGLHTLPVRALVGVLALVSSPMVVVSVIKESRARGPLAETAMGAAVLKDVVVLLAYSLLMALLVSLSGQNRAGAEDLTTVLASVAGQELALIAWSIALGVVIGWGLYRLTEGRGTGHRIGWLLVGLALIIALLEESLHVEPLFCLLAAGFSCENLWRGRSERGSHRLDQSLGRVALPVFVIFFMVAGLGLDLQALAGNWLPVLWFVALRASAIWLSVGIGARLSGCESLVQRWCWTAMIPQAGVTLALVMVIGEQFPTWGAELRDIVIAAIAVHELVGPVLLSVALTRAGETAEQRESAA